MSGSCRWNFVHASERQKTECGQRDQDISSRVPPQQLKRLEVGRSSPIVPAGTDATEPPYRVPSRASQLWANPK